MSNFTSSVSLTSTDGQAVLIPSPYVFTAADAGSHVFAGILKTAGTKTITATDAVDNVSGTESGIVVTAARPRTCV